MFSIMSSVMLALAAIVFHRVFGLDRSLGHKAAFIAGMHSAFILVSVVLLFGVIYGAFLWKKAKNQA